MNGNYVRKSTRKSSKIRHRSLAARSFKRGPHVYTKPITEVYKNMMKEDQVQ